MTEIEFSYRGESLHLVVAKEDDAIPRIVQRLQTFYELDVLERCEFYMGRLKRGAGMILDVGAYVGNHALFFSKFCQGAPVVVFEPTRSSFEALSETIRRNGLRNVTAYNLALGRRHGWGTIVIRDPSNLGGNSVRWSTQAHANAVRVVPLDALVETSDLAQLPISLIKIDVEGMECEVIGGAVRTVGRWQPILCIEVLDAAHLSALIKALKHTSYLVRECNGAAPTYILTWEQRIPPILVRAINYGWVLLAHPAKHAMRWRYRRLLGIALPV